MAMIWTPAKTMKKTPQNQPRRGGYKVTPPPPVPYKTPAKMRILNASEPLKRSEHCTTAVRMLFLSANKAKPQREGEFYTRPL